jgi:hypothetical protein
MDDSGISSSLGVVSLPKMSFMIPEGVHAIEIPLDQEERIAAVGQLIRDIYPRGDEALWREVEVGYGAIVDGLSSDGISFFGIGFYSVDSGVAHCSLNVAVIESDHPSREVAVRGIGAILQQEPLREVRWIDLPCGPAVSSVSFRNVVIDGRYTKTGEDQGLTFGQVQVYIPFPDAPYTAVFTMDTAALEQWDEFSRGMARIVRSVELASLQESQN